MTIHPKPGAPVRRRLVLAMLSTLASGTSPAAPQRVDMLDLPAASRARASRSLLLGVARAGARLIAVGERGMVLWSEDEGLHWTQAKVPVSVTLTAVQFVDERHGWVVGHDGVVLASADGGQTWQRRFDGLQANALVLASAQSRFDAASASGGQTLEEVQFALDDAKSGASFGPSRPLFGLHFTSPGIGTVVGAYGQVFETHDGGASWRSLGDQLGNHERLHLNAISVTSTGTMMVAAEAGKLYRSDDRGQRWRELSTGYAGSLYGVLDLGAPGARDLLAFGFGGRVFRTRDGGNSWQAVAGQPQRRTLVAGLRQSGSVLLLAQDGTLWWSGGDDSPLLRAARADKSRAVGLASLASGDRIAVAGTEGVVTVVLSAPKT